MTEDWEQPPAMGRHGQAVGVLAVAVAVAVLLAGRVTTPEADEPLPAPTPERMVAASPGVGSWRPLADAPLRPRSDHLAVWSGQEMIVWGGVNADGRALTNGAAYDPGTDTWRRIPPWWGHIGWPVRALWVDEEMVVIGEQAIAAYHPERERWRWLPTPPAGDWAWQSAGVGGGELILIAQGAERAAVAYPPKTNSWRELPAPPVHGWEGSSSLATGGTLVVAGLRGGAVALTRYVPAEDRWTPFSRAPARSRWHAHLTRARNHVIAAGPPGTWRWTGGGWFELPPLASGMREVEDLTLLSLDGDLLAWSGALVGAMFVGGRWLPLTDPPLAGRERSSAVWTGSELLVWGGGTAVEQFNDGAAFQLD